MTYFVCVVEELPDVLALFRSVTNETFSFSQEVNDVVVCFARDN